ncbi:MAG: hypothetical protein KBG83_00585 [Bacteroidetes bacterium]|nr:hypothetical protein [Bacteroidota bacterium]
MAKGQDNTRSAEQLKEVATYLKLADKLVREGNFAAALEEIGKARAKDPRNLYALAYEERVRSLVNQQKSETKPEEAGKPTAPQQIPTALEHISNLAIVEAQRSAAVAAKQEQEIMLRKKEEEERRKQEELRRKAIESKIAMFLQRAMEYEAKGDYNRALDEITRAYLLEPANEKIHELENRILRSQEEARAREEAERLQRQQEEERKRQEALKTQLARLQQEKEEKRRKEEEARKVAQQQKIRQYLQHAQELYAQGQFDEALSELAFVVVVDPLNEDVLTLERKIREAQDLEQQKQIEIFRKREEEQRKKREAIITAIQKHIENAEHLAAQGKYSDALRVITRAYVLDPINESLQQCEKKILAEQEDAMQKAEEQRRIEEEAIRKQQEEELRRLEQLERERALLGESAESEAKRRADKERIFQYLTKARRYLTENRFEDALGEVALAFIINPFDDDVKHMEQDILTAQEKKKAEDAVLAEQAASIALPVDDTAEKIAACIDEASRLAAEHKYSKALDEIAKAFLLDPLNETIQKYEAQLQKEFHDYQEEMRQKQEEESRIAALKGHIQRAKDFLEHEAFDEALAEVAEGYTYDQNNRELVILEKKIQEAYAQWQLRQAEEEKQKQIQEMVLSAKKFLSKHEFENALMEVTRAMVLDPENADIKALEQEIEASQEEDEERRRNEANTKAIKKLLFSAKEALIHHDFDSALAEIESALQIDPQDEESLALKSSIQQQKEEWLKKKSDEENKEKIKSHIRQARKLLKEKVYDEALIEIAMGLTADPNNEDLKDLEEQVVAAQAQDETAKEESGENSILESPLPDDEKSQLIYVHLRAADEFQKQNEFGKALDEVTKAYLIDPLNKEIKKAEIRIRQNQIRHAQQTGQTLKLIYPNDQQATGSGN